LVAALRYAASLLNGSGFTEVDQLKRRSFVTLLGGAAAAWPIATRAQQPAIPVIGFLSDASEDTFPDRLRAFRHGLWERGYVEGKNVVIEYRWANGQRDNLPALAADLVRKQVKVIAAIGGPPQALAAKQASNGIPIVFQVGADPVAMGLVESLGHPGGNITGVTSMNTDVVSKRLELMHQLAPSATSIALLVDPTYPVNVENERKEMLTAAQKLRLELHVLGVSSDSEFEAAFANLRSLKIGALMLSSAQLFTSNSQKLSALAIRDGIPTISAYHEFPAAGGLMSYGGDIAESWRLAGVYTGRVVKGERPTDLPVQQSTKFDFVINLKTAKTLGLAIPPGVLSIADGVIE
jgi:putative ABC transport system substrate-binding protein